MLNARFRGDHLRVGFDQDLRDEALLAFMSMFLLLPLALRQAHLWGNSAGIEVFSIDPERPIDVNNIWNWIRFFGSELAKAVPFVDWAEIYDVKGDGPIEMKTTVARHVVFATRVLVDLVFLAALLQAFATFARNSKQIELFEAGRLDRLDPFIEAKKFRSIVQRKDGGWETAEEFETFSRHASYNLTRLIELKGDSTIDPAVAFAAKCLYNRDYQGSSVSAELHEQLRSLTTFVRGSAPDISQIESVLSAIEDVGSLRQIEDLDDARRALAPYAKAGDVRRKIIEMIAGHAVSPDDPDYDLRRLALVKTLCGRDTIDSKAANRKTAFEALQASYLKGENETVEAFTTAAVSDPATNSLRVAIASWIRDNPMELASAHDEQDDQLEPI